MSSRPSRGAARLASILDALPDALLLVNANGTVVNANAIALETFETPGTALVGRGLLDLLPSFDPKRIPGSMRSPRDAEEDTRTKPTRMTARRTDGSEFPVQVTSANLEDGRTPYADSDAIPHFTGDELLMLVVRDLSGTVDTEAELARQQRQTEMILRAAAEGVVGVDTAGKIVLVNPSAAQILGHRATDLGGKELHPLVHHSRPDGSPLAYEETPLADTLRSGRKHRVRGQVLWRKDGKAVPVDLTTAPVRDGEQLVGAVMTFTDRSQYDALAARTMQLRALLDTSLRGPLAELRAELTGLAADPAGQLWPEANQILHHLSAGYARITTLIDNVLDFQRLDRGEDKLNRAPAGLDEVIGAAVDGAVELIGPGRAQYAVHAPPIQATLDAPRMVHALAHLIADVAGVDAAGNAIAYAGDSTIVVAAAQRGDVVRIDVRGPSAGGDPVHLPLARGIVERHGGVLQTHEVPGQGSAYVLEVPVEPGSGGGAKATRKSGAGAEPATREMSGRSSGDANGPGGSGRSGGPDGSGAPGAGSGTQGGDTGSGSAADGRATGERSTADDTGTVLAPWAVPPAQDQSEAPTGRRRALRRPGNEPAPAQSVPAENAQPTGRRARRARPGDSGGSGDGSDNRPEGDRAGHFERDAQPVQPGGQLEISGRRGNPPGRPGQDSAPANQAGPFALGSSRSAPDARPPHAPQRGPAGPEGAHPGPMNLPGNQHGAPGGPSGAPTGEPRHGHASAGQLGPVGPAGLQPDRAGPDSTGVAPAAPGAGTSGTPGAGGQPALPAGQPALPGPQPALPPGNDGYGGPDGTAAPAGPSDPAGPAGPGGSGIPDGGGRRGRRALEPAGSGNSPVPATPPAPPAAPSPVPGNGAPTMWPVPGAPDPSGGRPALPAQPSWPAAASAENGHRPQDPSLQSHGRAISVRTLGQGVPFAVEPAPQTPTQAVQAQSPQGLPAQVAAGGSGRRRRLAAPQGQPQPAQSPILPQVPSQVPGPGDETPARQHPQADPDSGQLPVRTPEPQPHHQSQHHQPQPQQPPQGQPNPPGPQDHGLPLPPRAVPPHPDAGGRSYAIGAPAEGADEGPEPLDGPNGAVDVTDDHQEEPLDEPRRLLVWPEPDVSTRQALTDRGYRPVIVRSREEVDAQIAEPPAALFVDPLTGPITRTALQSLRQAAAAADVPVLVTAGLGQATREAAYGADPAVLLKALAPRDSEQHPPRVLLVESHDPIAQAFAATLERRGMQVTHADSESDAMTKAAQIHPNLVVMDLMLIRRRRQGIVDWLRGNSRLNSTPLVVYTSADIDPAELPRLASGETVLFLAERSTSTDVQSRIVDLLGKIGT